MKSPFLRGMVKQFSRWGRKISRRAGNWPRLAASIAAVVFSLGFLFASVSGDAQTGAVSAGGTNVAAEGINGFTPDHHRIEHFAEWA